MPQKKEMPPAPKPQLVSTGSGVVAGLELWRTGDKIVLVDRSPDQRFAVDVATWNSAVVGLNATAMKKVKDAASANHPVTQ